MFYDKEMRKKMEEKKQQMEAERDIMLEMTETLGERENLFKMLNLEMKAKMKLETITDLEPSSATEEDKRKRVLFLTQINALCDQFLKGENNEQSNFDAED